MCLSWTSRPIRSLGQRLKYIKSSVADFLRPFIRRPSKLEFSDRGIPFQAQLELPIFYKGKKLKTHYRSDFVCYDDEFWL